MSAYASGQFKLGAADLIRLVETPHEKQAEQLATLGNIEGVAAALSVDIHKGLNGGNHADLKLREDAFGSNYIPPPPPRSKGLLELMWEAFQDVTTIVLACSGLFSIVLAVTVGNHPDTGWIEGACIIFAVFVVTFVTAVNDYQKERQFKALNAVKDDEKIKCIRDGVPCEISKYQIFVGDIVINGKSVKANGTVEQKEEYEVEHAQSPLEAKLYRLTILIGKLRTSIALLVFFIMSIRFSVTKFSTEKQGWNNKYTSDYLQFFIISITVLVVAIPEGLPLAVTIALAYSFLQFQLTVNVVAITLAQIGAIVLEQSPLTTVQLLWLNLIMDSFASLSLATEPPTPALLDRRPYPKTKPLLSKAMTKHIFGQAALQLVILLWLTFSGEKTLGVQSGRFLDLTEEERLEPSVHLTMVFNPFVWLQLFNELNCHKIHDEINVLDGIMGNDIHHYVTAFQVGMQIIIVQFTGRFFSCAPLTAGQWGISIGLGAVSLPFGLLLRLLSSKRLLHWMAICHESDAVEVHGVPGLEKAVKKSASARRTF